MSNFTLGVWEHLVYNNKRDRNITRLGVYD